MGEFCEKSDFPLVKSWKYFYLHNSFETLRLCLCFVYVIIFFFWSYYSVHMGINDTYHDIIICFLTQRDPLKVT